MNALTIITLSLSLTYVAGLVVCLLSLLPGMNGLAIVALLVYCIGIFIVLGALFLLALGYLSGLKLEERKR